MAFLPHEQGFEFAIADRHGPILRCARSEFKANRDIGNFVELPAFRGACKVLQRRAGGELSWQRIGCGVVLAVILSLSAYSRVAHAQALPSDTIRATPKGTIGLGLVGAELGLIIPAAAGLTDPWALTVFPVVGAAGGALAGYFALDKPGREKGSVAALAVGLAGVLPAILVTVKGVRKERQEAYEPPAIEIRSDKEQRALELVEAGPGLLRRSRSGLRVSMPGVSFSRGPALDAETAKLGGVKGRTELRLSLASGVF